MNNEFSNGNNGEQFNNQSVVQNNNQQVLKKSKSPINILLVLIIIGLVGYICYDKYKFNDNGPLKQEEVKTEEVEQEEVKETKCDNSVKLSIDSNNVINNDNIDYMLGERDGFITFEQRDNAYVIYLDKDEIKQSYNDIDVNKLKDSYNINSNKSIVEVNIVYVGQSVNGCTVLFLMSDGTVEYIPLYDALHQYELKSYGAISGVSDVVTLTNVSALPKGSNYAHSTTLGLKADGTFYDIFEYLAKLTYYENAF